MAQEPPGPHREQTIDWDESAARMRSMIRAHAGNITPEDLHDWTLIGLTKFLRKLRRDGHAKDPIALLATIASTTAKDYIRWIQRRRARFVDWEAHLDSIIDTAAPPEEVEDERQVLWFLLVEYLRVHHAPCARLAQLYAEHGDWDKVAEAIGASATAVRKQWSRCTQAFRDELKRNPGRFQEWLNDA
jgi:hypothetical protein